MLVNYIKNSLLSTIKQFADLPVCKKAVSCANSVKDLYTKSCEQIPQEILEVNNSQTCLEILEGRYTVLGFQVSPKVLILGVVACSSLVYASIQYKHLKRQKESN